MAREPRDNKVTRLIAAAEEVPAAGPKDANDVRQAAGSDKVRRIRETAEEVPPFGGDGGGPGDGGDDIEPVGLLDPKDPLAIARTFLNIKFTRGAWRTLLLWRGDWYHWTRNAWQRIDELELRGIAYFWLEGTHKRDRSGKLARFCPNANSARHIFAS